MLPAAQIQEIVDEARTFLIRSVQGELDAYPDFWGPARCGTPEEILDRHLKPELSPKTATREDILSRLLMSAQNRHSGPRVILGGLTEGWAGLRDMLCGFSPEKILETWAEPDQLLSFFAEQRAKGRIRGQLAVKANSMWPQFSRSILSAARLLSQYPEEGAFTAWLDRFIVSEDTAAALPLILAQEIDGFGLALACDFLKELGYTQFPKPDTHVNKLARALGISNANGNYRRMLDLQKAAASIKISAYEFDKLLWLIGSGRFYLVVVGDDELRIGRRADAFIEHMTRVRGRRAT